MYLQWPVHRYQSAAATAALEIEASVHEWATKHDVAYTSKLARLGYRISFDDPKHFTLFALTWSSPHDGEWFQFDIKDPMRIDRHR